ncbi:MAG: hypothetical protein SVO96_11540 [Pseudomonadota bacterium]|nr:hypothetical protein [Pseudomonadota bacterium]
MGHARRHDALDLRGIVRVGGVPGALQGIGKGAVIIAGAQRILITGIVLEQPDIIGECVRL